jgi:hypothetical protein
MQVYLGDFFLYGTGRGSDQQKVVVKDDFRIALAYTHFCSTKTVKRSLYANLTARDETLTHKIEKSSHGTATPVTGDPCPQFEPRRA